MVVDPTQYVDYAVSAVDSTGLSSALTLAIRHMPNGVDTDGDGIPDSWMIQYFGHPTGSSSDHSFAQDNPAGDGLSNLQKYQLGLNPLVPARPYLQAFLLSTNGAFALSIQQVFGRSGTLQFSTNLINWEPLRTWPTGTANLTFEDVSATNSQRRFYRALMQ